MTPVERYVVKGPSGPYGPWSNAAARNKSAQDVHSIDQTWRGYPQNLFGNWTPEQVIGEMLNKCPNNQPSTIYWMDVLPEGKFTTPNIGGNGHHTTSTNENDDEFWNMLQRDQPYNVRVSGGYTIDPFFFTSSFDWKPSQHQGLIHEEGDHIIITLPFVRTQPFTSPTPLNPRPLQNASNRINFRALYPMCIDDMFAIDLLAICMIRTTYASTIISYHPESTSTTSAKVFHSLMLAAGESVYWKNIFSQSRDPTFVFLAMLWYALHAWDESSDLLHNHLSSLESKVLEESDAELTRELHAVQSHLLQYESHLHAFHVSVSFLEKAPNPIVESIYSYDEMRMASNELMKTVCGNLLGEINRIGKQREMMGDRTKNALNLVFANVNIRDSASMRLISYLTMIFLPASFMASIFGMNVKEISGSASFQTLAHYIEATIVLTLLTVYIVMTLRTYSAFHVRGAGLLQRAAWPFIFLWKLQARATQAGAKKAGPRKARAKTADDEV